MANPKAKPGNENFKPGKNILEKKVGIVCAEWNTEITGKLLDGARKALLEYGIAEENLLIKHVPGSFELPLGAQFLMEFGRAEGVICLGCLIKGETPHFDFISNAVSNKLMELNLSSNRPVIFGVLTTNTEAQAKARAGGNKGNKGEESAVSLLKMLSLREELRSSNYGKIGLKR